MNRLTVNKLKNSFNIYTLVSEHCIEWTICEVSTSNALYIYVCVCVCAFLFKLKYLVYTLYLYKNNT